jgi:hypothetical protein
MKPSVNESINVRFVNIAFFISVCLFWSVICLPLTVEAWRCSGFLAQKFNRITAVEPYTNVSSKYETRHIAKPMFVAVSILCRSFYLLFRKYSVLVLLVYIFLLAFRLYGKVFQLEFEIQFEFRSL